MNTSLPESLVDLKYFFNGELISKVASRTDLGLDITDNLSWNDHCNNICQKANSVSSDESNLAVFWRSREKACLLPNGWCTGLALIGTWKICQPNMYDLKICKPHVAISLPAAISQNTRASRSCNCEPFHQLGTSK